MSHATLTYAPERLYSSDFSITRFSWWLGSLVVRTLDLRLNGREFDPRPPHYRSLGTGIGDRLRVGIPPRCETRHTGQLSLLPSVGREMSTGQIAVMRFDRGLKARLLIPFVDKRMGGR